jgi:LytS/YehU family sensor histidine kinase
MGWIGAFPRGAAGLYTMLSAFGVLLYLLSIAISYLLVVFERTQAAERQALEGEVLSRDAQLRTLRAQIDPHFLFNSLHSISALTAADPAGARRMCVLLGDFLRESLALGGQDRIPLGREVGLARRFLAVERVRFGERLSADIVVAPDAEGFVVPALLLQPLVENAVTHGIAHVVSGGIVRVRAEQANGRLRITVENPCDHDRPRRTGTGVGLTNVRARLAALHGAEAHVAAEEKEGVWRVELSLPAVMET